MTFSVDHGEILGLIGPNGAGKSSTIRIILDFMKLDSGEVQIFGQEMNGACKNQTRRLYPPPIQSALLLPSFAKAPDSNRWMTGEEGTLRSPVKSVVGYASEGSAPKHVKKPPAPAGGASPP